MNKAQAGAIGGKSTSTAKAEAAKINGCKGGRPKKAKEGKWEQTTT